MTTDSQIPQLVAEVQALNSAVRDLLARTPHPSRTWLKPSELALMANLSVRTVALYRERGCIQPKNMRPTSTGFEYREGAVADIEAARMKREAY